MVVSASLLFIVTSYFHHHAKLQTPLRHKILKNYDGVTQPTLKNTADPGYLNFFQGRNLVIKIYHIHKNKINDIKSLKCLEFVVCSLVFFCYRLKQFKNM